MDHPSESGNFTDVRDLIFFFDGRYGFGVLRPKKGMGQNGPNGEFGNFTNLHV